MSRIDDLPGNAVKADATVTYGGRLADLGGVPSADPTLPKTMGRFQVLALLGEGGMGRVYQARDADMGGRTVALKVISRRVDEFALSQLRGEMADMAKFNHPNILQVYEPGLDEATRETFIVMEFAPGGSLDKQLRREPQPPRLAAAIAEKLAGAVQYIHAQNLIHRDLKPQNVLLAQPGEVRPEFLKVADFGLAKPLVEPDGASASRYVAGTPKYMAPEQTTPGEVLTGAVDVYALGVILYEMLTGRVPFQPAADGTSKGRRGTLTDQIRWEDPVPPGKLIPHIPRDLEVVCLKCLRKSPAGRYPSAQALADDLCRFLNEEPVLARPAPRWERTARWVRRRPWQAALAATVSAGGVLLGATGLMLYKAHIDEKVRRTQLAADEELRAEKEKAADIKRKQDDDFRAKLQAQHKQSLEALNGIRELVLNGQLSNIEGLDPLHAMLVEYYKKATNARDADSPRLAAEATAKLGDLFRRTGGKGESVKAYARAIDLYGSLPDPTPADRHEWAKARLERGKLLTLGQDRASAAADFDAAAAVWGELTAADPQSIEYGLLLAEVWHQRGEMLAAQKRWKDAQQAHDSALDRRRILLADRPDNLAVQKDYARSLGYLGDVYLEIGDIRRADRAYWESHRVRSEIVRRHDAATARTDRSTAGADLDPRGDARTRDAAEAKFQLSRSWLNLAAFQDRLGVTDTAVHFAKLARALRDELAARYPNETRYKTGRANAIRRVAELRLTLADRQPPADRAKAIEDGNPIAAKFVSGISKEDEGGKSAADGNLTAVLDDARNSYQEVLRKSPKDPEATQGSGITAALTAAALADYRDRIDDAQKNLRDANRILGEIVQADGSTAEVRYVLAGVRSLASDLGVILDGVDPKDLGLTDLEHSVRGGYRGTHPENLRTARWFRAAREGETRRRFEAIVRQMTDPPTERP